MYRVILVPLDGSALAEGVLPYVRALASRLNADVKLFQVVDPAQTAEGARLQKSMSRDVHETRVLEEAKGYLETVARTFAGLTRAPTCIAVLGKSAEKIVEESTKSASTLIAMSTHGRSGLGRWLLGSVADKVLHTCAVPMLLIRTTEHIESKGLASIRSIIVPLDGSKLAEAALEHAAGVAKALASEVVLLRVVAVPITMLASVDVPVALEQAMGEVESEAREYLDARTALLTAQGVKARSVLLRGSAAAQVVDLAKGTPNVLIAITTRGLSGISRMVLGSVTDRVVQHAGNPVLVIRSAG